MKIIKSGALTVFVALTLIASQEAYAMPRGRSLSPTSKTLDDRSFEFTSAHPNPSLPGMNGISKAAMTLAHKKQMWTEEEEKSMGEDDLSERNISQENFNNIFIDKIEPRKQEATKSEWVLISAIEYVLEDDFFSNNFQNVALSMMELKGAAERESFSENALACTWGAICRLYNLKKENTIASNAHSILRYSIDHLGKSLWEGAPEKEVKDLIADLKDLERELMPLTMQNAGQAMNENPLIASLAKPFEIFLDDVRRIEDLNSGDINGVINLLQAIIQTEEVQDENDVMENLKSAIFSLKSMKSGPLETSAKTFKVALKTALNDFEKKKLFLGMQEAQKILRASPLLKDLEGPFQAFSDVMQEIEDLKYLTIAGILLKAIVQAAQAQSPNDTLDGLRNAIYYMDITMHECVTTHESLQVSLSALKETVKKALKEVIPQAAQEIAQAVEKNPLTTSLIEPFQAFLDAMQGLRDVNSYNVKKSLKVVSRLRGAVQANNQNDALNAIKRTIKTLNKIRSNPMKEPAETLRAALIKTLEEGLKEELSRAAQKAVQAMEKNPLTTSLIEPFQAFLDAMQAREDMGSDDMLCLLQMINCTAEAENPNDVFDALRRAMSGRGVTECELANTRMWPLKDLLKKVLHQVIEKMTQDLRSSRFLKDLVEPLQAFVNDVQEEDGDMNSDDTKKSLKAISRLRYVMQVSNQENALNAINRTIKALSGIENELLQESASAFMDAIEKAGEDIKKRGS